MKVVRRILAMTSGTAAPGHHRAAQDFSREHDHILIGGVHDGWYKGEKRVKKRSEPKRPLPPRDRVRLLKKENPTANISLANGNMVDHINASAKEHFDRHGHKARVELHAEHDGKEPEERAPGEKASTFEHWQRLKAKGELDKRIEIKPITRVGSSETNSGTALRNMVRSGKKQKFIKAYDEIAPHVSHETRHETWRLLQKHMLGKETTNESKSFAQLREELEQYK